MKAVYFIFLFIFNGFYSYTQISFHQNVAPLLKQHCTSCHHQKGPAPFALETYNDVSKRASFILEVIEKKYMPPYPADPLFREHANANILLEDEIEIIRNWIKEGKPEGKIISKNSGLLPAITKIIPDLSLHPSRPFVIPGDNKEKFKIFVVPTNLSQSKFVSAVEYIPGNARRTHHSRIMIDTTNFLRNDNGIDVGDSSEFQKSGIQLYDEFWKGWLPGNNTSVFYPAGMAKLLPAKSDFVINTHYAPGILQEADNFSINIYFAKEPPKRIVETFIVDESRVVNGPFILPPDTLLTFYAQTKPLQFDISVLSVLPHMHYLGKSFKAFCITPGGEVIPLIHIPKWQFNWQLTYPFKKLLKLPKGSVIYIQATYDNTINNELNPFHPPRWISYGWGTKNEMLNLILEYVEYQPGDEMISTQ